MKIWFSDSRRLLAAIITAALLASCAPSRVTQHSSPSRKALAFEQMDFEDMLKRYLGRDFRPESPIEGIYEVSCTVTKRGKRFLSRVESDKIVMRKDTYAKVAIVKDWPESEREYLEISLNTRGLAHYPVIGDFHSFSEGSGFIYKHYNPKASSETYTFVQDLQPEVLEGSHSFMKGSKTIIYKLTYIKIYPKRSDVTATK